MGAEQQDEVFAGEFLDHAREGFYDAHNERPVCLGLLGHVAARRVLDAACGPGLYAEALLAHGAQVIGFDQGPRMIDLCRQPVPSGEFRVHDLASPLDWMPDSSVDLVLLASAIEYVDERIAALRELHRVLRATGALALSRQHPTGDWLRHGGSCFDVHVIEEVWSRGWKLRCATGSRRSSRRATNSSRPVSSSKGLLEPRPAPTAAQIDVEEQ